LAIKQVYTRACIHILMVCLWQHGNYFCELERNMNSQKPSTISFLLLFGMYSCLAATFSRAEHQNHFVESCLHDHLEGADTFPFAFAWNIFMPYGHLLPLTLKRSIRNYYTSNQLSFRTRQNKIVSGGSFVNSHKAISFRNIFMVFGHLLSANHIYNFNHSIGIQIKYITHCHGEHLE